MAANTTPIFPAAPVSAPVQFLNADGTTAKQIYAPTLTNGARVVGLTLTSTDTATNSFQLFVRKGGVNYLIGTTAVAANAGNLGTVSSLDVMQGIINASGLNANPFLFDAYGNSIIYLDVGSTLFGGVLTTITSGKQVNLVTWAEEF
jgi:hypothetical protein